MRGYTQPNVGTAPELPSEVAAAAADPLNVVGRYVRVARIGAGGMGEVWKAWDGPLARWVALKFLKGGDDEEIARFEREARTAGKLAHPGIAAVYDVGEDRGRHYIAMQLVDGHPLVPGRRALAQVRDAARAIAHAHRHGIVHRDVKPDNILVDGAGRVYVMDFGLARTVAAGGSLTMSGMVVGTPAYMSPEQARAERVDARSDIYSLGATLYQAVTGRPPFDGAGVFEILTKVVEEDPAPPGSSREVEAVLSKAMAKDARLRYATAEEFADDLDRIERGEKPRAALAGSQWSRRLDSARRWTKRRLALVAGVLVAAAGLLVGVVLVVKGRATAAQQAIDQKRREEATACIAEADRLRLEAELHGRVPDPDSEAIVRTLRRAEAACTAAEPVLPGKARTVRARIRTLLGDLAGAEADAGGALAGGADPALHAQRAWIRARRYQLTRGVPLPICHGRMLRRVVAPGETAASLALRTGGEQDLAAARGADVPERRLAEALFALTGNRPREAQEILVTAAAANPIDPAPLTYLALSHLALAEFPEAIRALERALRLRPSDPQALLALAHADFARSDYAACERLLDRAEKADSDPVAVRRLRGAAAAEAGDLPRARRLLEEARQLRPDDAFTAILRYYAEASAVPDGPSEFRLPRAADAPRFDELLHPAVDSDAAPGLLCLLHAIDLIALGRDDLALETLDRALRRDPWLAMAYLWRALLHCRTRNWRAALDDAAGFEEHAGREREGDRLQSFLLTHLGREWLDPQLHAAVKGEEAFYALGLHTLLFSDRLEEELGAKPTDRDSWLYHWLMAHDMSRRHDKEGVRAEATAALATRDDLPGMYVLRAKTRSDTPEELADLEAALRLDPFDSMSQYNLANAHFRARRFDSAAVLLLRNTYFYSNGGKASEAIGALATWGGEALPAWPEVVRLAANPSYLWLGLSIAASKTRDDDACLRAAEESLKLDNSEPLARLMKLDVLVRLHRPPERADPELFGPTSSPTLAATRIPVLTRYYWLKGDREAASKFLLNVTASGPGLNQCRDVGSAIRRRLDGGTWQFASWANAQWLIDCLVAVGDIDSLIEVTERYVSRPPQPAAQAWLYRARVLEVAARRDEALKAVNRTLALSVGDPVASPLAARLLIDMGRPQEALEVLAQPEGEPPPRHYWESARALAALGRRAEALGALRSYENAFWRDTKSTIHGPMPSRSEFDALKKKIELGK